MNYTTILGQRFYSMEIEGVKVTAWRDGCSISVRSEGNSLQSFNDSKWTIKNAIKFYAKITA